MASDADPRHDDDSLAAGLLDRPPWIWSAAAAMAVTAIIVLLASAATGPGANAGIVAAGTARVEGGVAPGVGSSFAGQPGGRPDGKPSPDPNAPKEDATL